MWRFWDRGDSTEHRPHVSGDFLLADRIAADFVKMSEDDRDETVGWVHWKLQQMKTNFRCSLSQKLRSRILYEILSDWAAAGTEKDEFYKKLIDEDFDSFERQASGDVKVGPVVYSRERLERPLAPDRVEAEKERIREVVRDTMAEIFLDIMMGSEEGGSSEEDEDSSEGTVHT